MTELVEVTQAEVDAALATFNGGLVRQQDERNERGYTTYYHPQDSMRSALESFARHRIESLTAQLAEARGEGWRTIETHGGDEAECLIAILDQHGQLYVADRGWWQPGEKREEWDEVEDGICVKLWEDEDDGSWLSNHGYLEEPTHWRPLPEPPSAIRNLPEKGREG